MVAGMNKLAQCIAIPMICLSMAGLAGCGFHLRGTQTAAIPAEYQQLTLNLPKEAKLLDEPLRVYLQSLGVTVNQNKQAPVLKITDYSSVRQLLSGRLTEVQLRLQVTFHIEDSLGNPLTTENTIYARRNYQYAIDTVNTENQEEAHLIEQMNLDAAQQIARQLHAGRLQYFSAVPAKTAVSKQ
jgi:LPS-assembly lipoprotein